MGGPMGGGGGGGGPGRGGPNDKVEAFFNVPANKCGLVIGKGECGAVWCLSLYSLTMICPPLLCLLPFLYSPTYPPT